MPLTAYDDELEGLAQEAAELEKALTEKPGAFSTSHVLVMCSLFRRMIVLVREELVTLGREIDRLENPHD